MIGRGFSPLPVWIDFASRLRSAPMDIGAYEFDGAGDAIPPASPLLLE